MADFLEDFSTKIIESNFRQELKSYYLKLA